MEKDAVKKTHNATSFVLVILGLIILFTQFMYLGILFVILGILFSILCRAKSVEKAFELQNPLSISILIFALLGIMGFPITVLFYNVFFKEILIVWLAAFVIYYLIIASFLKKGK